MPQTYISIGGFRCFPLHDGALPYPTAALFPNRSDAEVADALAPEAVRSEITVGYSGLLIDTGQRRILIDTGAGSHAASTGHLSENMKSCGFAPEEIDLVILSHLHPDHIGGLTIAGGGLRFPNAEVVFSRAENDFWMSESNQEKLKSMTLFGLGEVERLMLSQIQSNILPLMAAGRVRLIENDCGLATGVEVVSAFGHTPGHLAVLISDGGEQMLFGGDAILQPAHIRYPEWTTAFDVLPEQAASTRRQMLDRIASDHCLTFHYHFPFPCLGSISRWNNGYRWEPSQL